MLLGFTSRWTIPWSCAETRASAACASRVAASVASSGPDAPHPLAQRLAVDVLHHQPAHVLLVDEVEDGDDVRVVERGGETGLALGALELDVVPPGISPMRLIATWRPSTSSSARCTVPEPPRPISRSSLYLPAITCRPPCVTRPRLVPDHQPDSTRRNPRDHPERPRRAGVARPRRPLHRPRRAPRGAGRGERQVLRGLRPDRAEPPHGQPRPAGHRPPPAGRRPHAVHPRRRRHRDDRRPAGLRGAHAQLPRHGQGVDRARAAAGLAAS